MVAVGNYSMITQPPLGIGYLAAYARQLGHEVHVVDGVGDAVKQFRSWPYHKKRLVQGRTFSEIIERIPSDSDVIGVSCMFTHAWPLVRELIISIKKEFPNAKLIAGGEHVTAMYDTVLKQTSLDFCVTGEGELTLAELLTALQNEDSDYSKIGGIAFIDASQRVIKTERRKRVMDPDELPWPAWDLLDPMAYEMYHGPAVGRTMPMLATRGCPFECTFCSSPNMWTQVWKARKPASVADEIESYMKRYSATDFQFQDLTAIIRKDWIVSFCQELIKRNLKITWQLPVGTRSEAIDGEVAKYLIASGCHHITYAPESGSEPILAAIKKKVKPDRLEASAKACLDAGMRVCLFAIVGFPQEEMKDIKKSFKWFRHMAKIGVHEISISTFTPLPGTQLFRDINAVTPIPLDDEYCYSMSNASNLLSAKSWNPKIGNRRLLFLKLLGYFQFYSLSFLYYPQRLWKLIRNIFLKKEETKVDRVLHELLNKIPVALRLKDGAAAERQEIHEEVAVQR